MRTKRRVEYRKEYDAQNRDQIREYQRAYRAARGELVNTNQREYRANVKLLGKRGREVTMHYYEAVEYLGGKCTDCGYNKDLRALQFDHVPERGQKTYSISAILKNGWATIKTELDKCDLVCANCHCIRTHTRGQYKWRTMKENREGIHLTAGSIT